MKLLSITKPASRQVILPDPTPESRTAPVPVFDPLFAEEMREALRPAPAPKPTERMARREPYQLD